MIVTTRCFFVADVNQKSASNDARNYRRENREEAVMTSNARFHTYVAPSYCTIMVVVVVEKAAAHRRMWRKLNATPTIVMKASW